MRVPALLFCTPRAFVAAGMAPRGLCGKLSCVVSHSLGAGCIDVFASHPVAQMKRYCLVEPTCVRWRADLEGPATLEDVKAGLKPGAAPSKTEEVLLEYSIHNAPLLIRQEFKMIFAGVKLGRALILFVLSPSYSHDFLSADSNLLVVPTFQRAKCDLVCPFL